ncbi:13601_t:CDS:2 [Rhizophagus irregularis]|nr:13601_t:CDS:2 [Rhizophagus irregularis]
MSVFPPIELAKGMYHRCSHDMNEIIKFPIEKIIWTALSFAKERCNVQFNKAEEKRLELIKLKKLGPDFTEKFHSDATYTSRISSNNSLFEYITKEYDYDINTQSQQSTTHITNVQDFPTKNSSRKRHMEELRIETQYDRKRIKA